MMGLKLTRLPDETWEETVKRYSSKYGLSHECLQLYDEEVANGVEKSAAAWHALYEWDCLDYVENVFIEIND